MWLAVALLHPATHAGMIVPPDRSGSDGIGSAQVKIRGDELRITGKIDRSTSSAFSALMHGPNSRGIISVRVNSTGGDARPTLEIASWIRDRKLKLIVDQICGSACAAYLLPAASEARFEPGATINLHHMPSPLFTRIAVKWSKRKDGVETRSGQRLSAASLEAGLNRLISDQRAFYKSLHVDPLRMESIMDVWVELRARLQALGKPVDADKISFVPDNHFIQQCLGLHDVKWRNFDTAESIVYARRGNEPQAFLINGRLYFEGALISPKDFSCSARDH